MNLYIFGGISVIVLIATLVEAFIVSKLNYKRKRILTPNKALILGVFLSAAILFIPLYLEEFKDELGWVEWVKSILISIQHSIRLFAFDGDYMDIVEAVEDMEGLDPNFQMAYTGLAAAFYFAAPLLTFGVILSFFKNFSAHRKYFFSFLKHTHVFSELNEKSLALAKSIDKADNKNKKGKYKLFRKSLIVFTDMMDKDDEESLELLEEAKEIGAVLFAKDLESIKYRKKYLSFRKVSFYLISEDEEEKIRHAESIMRDYDYSDKIHLRLFSDDIRSELFMAAKTWTKMKANRVNDIQTLIYHNLDTHGLRLFKNARCVNESEKTISAVIVGLGKYGVEMLKALTWFCQMPGYRVKITAFDKDENAKKTFTNMCPELMSDDFNKQRITGETQYDIDIYGGINTNSSDFFEKLAEIKDATYIFVCLGSDEENLSTAVKIRSLYESIDCVGNGEKPDIETVIYDSNIRDMMGVKWGDEIVDDEGANLNGVANFNSQPYYLHIIGDLENFYSTDTLLDSDLVKRGENVNIRWAQENNPEAIEIDKKKFDKFEYNYRSSIAKAIHEKLREDMHKELKIDFPGFGMPREDILKDPSLCLKIGRIEHIRWNAYMRTEGYSCGQKTDHLAKKHKCLVSVEELNKTEEGRNLLRRDV